MWGGGLWCYGMFWEVFIEPLLVYRDYTLLWAFLAQSNIWLAWRTVRYGIQSGSWMQWVRQKICSLTRLSMTLQLQSDGRDLAVHRQDVVLWWHNSIWLHAWTQTSSHLIERFVQTAWSRCVTVWLILLISIGRWSWPSIKIPMHPSSKVWLTTHACRGLGVWHMCVHTHTVPYTPL